MERGGDENDREKLFTELKKKEGLQQALCKPSQ